VLKVEERKPPRIIEELTDNMKLSEVIKWFKGTKGIQRFAEEIFKKIDEKIVAGEDIMPFCQLAEEGILEEIKDAKTDLDTLKKEVTLRKYENIMPEISAISIGTKIMKNYCNQYIDYKPLLTFEKNLREEIDKINEILEEPPFEIYNWQLNKIQKRYGAYLSTPERREKGV